MWILIVSIFVVILIGIGLIAFFFYVLIKAFKPDSPQEQLKEFGVNLIGYEFCDGYKVLESISRNNHPDRPQKLKIELDDIEFERLQMHIDKLIVGEEKKEKDDTLYVKTICKNDNSCSFVYSAIHKTGENMFFRASAMIDYSTKTVSFSSNFF